MHPIDLSEALHVTDGDVELLAEVIEAFCGEYPGLLDQINSAIASGDHVTLQRASHTIKGSLRLFGDTEAIGLARQLEERGRMQSIADAHGLFSQLQASLDTVAAQLKLALAAMQSR